MVMKINESNFPIVKFKIKLFISIIPKSVTKLKLRGFSPRANHTDRAAGAGRRS
jgi:hypothetical protein